jgi:AraC family transcriptional regulator, positive regulator of tynA and feaB
MPEHFALTDSAQTVRCWCDQYATRPVDNCRADARKTRQLRCGLARVTVTEVSGEAQQISTRPVSTGQHLLMIVPVVGQFTVRAGEGELQLGPDQGCLLSNGASYAIEFREPFRQIHLRFHVDEINRQCPGWSRSLAQRIDCAQGVGAMLKQSLQSVLDHGRRVDLPATRSIWRAMQHLMAATLLDASLESPRPSDIAGAALKTRIDQTIESELRNPELGIGLITQRVGVSPRHLHRLYAREQQTLMRTIRDVRLDRCYQDLTSASQRALTINEIALSWGFNDQAHFSRQFRRRFGVTARDARAAAGAGAAG